MSRRPNPNLTFAETLVDGLARAGLRAACFTPGSRSTPLALAFDAHAAIEIYQHLDERCASFFALGLAQASGRPVAALCTSGTAPLEFHPAVVEAQMAGVPLLLLTADRPPELRDSGANQTIDQVKMYGDHVLWAVDAALPQDDAPDIALRNLSALAARAYAIANGLRKGPVHINIPFRKPLEPPAPYTPRFATRQATSIQRGVMTPTPAQVDELAELLAARERGWIVCGPWAGRAPAALVDAVAELARRAGYPIFADPLSGLRFGPHTASTPIVSSYESFLQHPPDFAPPQVVIRFGAVPTSKSLNEYLDRAAPYLIHVRGSGVWGDDSHRVHTFLQVDEEAFCRRLAERTMRPFGQWGAAVMAAEKECRRRQTRFLQENWFDAAAIPAILDALPQEVNLFVGNSLAVRHVDQFGPPCQKEIHVFGNRGASGMDGIVSCALGVAAAEPSTPALLLIGDISFYHDLNGLLAIRKYGLGNVTIVLLHNNGGGIFRRLPITRVRAQFEELFLTPHALDFAPAAAMYDLDHARPSQAKNPQENRTALAEALAASLGSDKPTLIELHTDGERDERLRQEWVKTLKDNKRKDSKEEVP